MNMHVSPPSWAAVRWDEHLSSVNEWRGACLDVFARGEASVTETLLTLQGQRDLGCQVRLPHLFGEKLERLSQALAEPAYEKAAQALSAFMHHHGFRNTLCHGVAKLVADRHGCWSVIIKTTGLRAGRPTCDIYEFSDTDMIDRLSQLRRDGQVLGSTLGNLRKSLTQAVAS